MYMCYLVSDFLLARAPLGLEAVEMVQWVEGSACEGTSQEGVS